MDIDTSPRALRRAGNDALSQALHDLQREAFAVYEAAASAAEGGDATALARAEATVAPLIARAQAVNDERVRRLRARARRWWIATVAVAAAGVAAIGWLLLARA